MSQYLYTNQYQRSEHNLYIEQRWCSRLLFDRVKFEGAIHDPACGTGNILYMATVAGYKSTGSDIEDRGDNSWSFYDPEGFEKLNFFGDFHQRDNIVSNPPYEKGLLERFIDHALHVAENKIAVLVRLAFLEGQERYKNLYTVHRPALVLVFSTRPSIGPPGAPPTGGKTPYCWIIWDKQETNGKTELDWIIA